MNQPNDPIRAIIHWFELAKPNPTIKNIFTQLGCHFEEISEMVQAFDSDAGELHQILTEVADELKTVDVVAHSDRVNEQLSKIDRVEMLDALCDQVVTAIGTGYDMGFDMYGAINEVIRSNYSKFENGQPIFDTNGKIQKGKDYSKPDLTPFVGDVK
ncbi:hypothetical protein ACFBZI_10610 [Moraxella sp. ZJ142]|uniref:hypothetical protein n=1 Tax=Moraxella marmotae TaxID=3344520 RepID=UPI0035D474E2